MDTLTRHAAGQLPPAKARLVAEHLLACEDGRCGEFVRSQAAEMGVASDHLEAAAPELAGERLRPRTFQSREIVWATFESMSRELGVSMDDLMNDAMAAYARVRGYAAPDETLARPAAPEPARKQARAAAPVPATLASATYDDRDPLEETHDAPAISALDRSYSPPAATGFDDDDDLARTAAREAFVRPAAGRRAPISDVPESRTIPQRKAFPLPAALSRPVPLSPRSSGGGGLGPPPARASRQAPPARATAGGLAPPPLPGRSAAPGPQRMPGSPRDSSPPVSSGAKQLVLSYLGRQYPVDKERFLLGRSKAQSDLRLDDPNVSRQHAAIERVGAAWYVVDLGSTNGVHVAGERVGRRALSDGDLIVITSHEIRCSLR